MAALEELTAEIEAMTALLKNLAASACDHCGEKQCADCWAIEYNETSL